MGMGAKARNNIHGMETALDRARNRDAAACGNASGNCTNWWESGSNCASCQFGRASTTRPIGSTAWGLRSGTHTNPGADTAEGTTCLTTAVSGDEPSKCFAQTTTATKQTSSCCRALCANTADPAITSTNSSNPDAICSATTTDTHHTEPKPRTISTICFSDSKWESTSS